MANDEERGKQPEQSTDAGELEIELHGEPEPASGADGDDVLEVTAEELAELPEAAQLPAVSALDALVADGTANWVDIPAICSQTDRGFIARFEEVKPGRYEYIGAQPVTGTEDKSQMTGGYRDVKGEFHLTDYPGCPVCGSPGLAVCSDCQTVSCGGSARKTKRGWVTTCPHCHQDGELIPGGPATQVRAEGDMKKKKW